METLGADAFKVLLVVIPGIVSLRIKAALSISAPSNPFNATIDGLILTLVDHFVYVVAAWFVRAMLPVSWWDSLLRLHRTALESSTLRGEFGRLFFASGGFWIILIAVGVGLAAGIIRYHGWDFWFLRSLKMTNRTGEALVWAETFTKAPPAYAVVACKDGSRFMGWVNTFSEEAGNYEVFLSRASQVQEDGSMLPIDGPGVLLTRENPITRVELWNPVRDDIVSARREV